MTKDKDLTGFGRGPDTFDEIETQVAFILNCPRTSDWLKEALRNALPRDPIAILNDLEILTLVLRRRATRMLDVRPK
jgi:hypothetical protein